MRLGRAAREQLPFIRRQRRLDIARARGNRMLERIGQQVRALEVPERAPWSTVQALLSYILGVSAQNAANARIAQELDVERASFLDEIAVAWSELDPETFPFTRSLANQIRTHDDREDFLAGIDLILAGIETKRAR
nr:hypothetical protein [Burkholderia gladioli]